MRHSTRLATTFALGLLINGSLAEANPVLEWNAVAASAVRIETHPPGLTARNLAILHRAIERAATDESVPVPFQGAAVSAAAHGVCSALYPSQRSTFDVQFAKHKERVPPGDPREHAFRVGLEASRFELVAGQGDGSGTTVHYRPSPAPGSWERVTRNRPPELPHWSKVRPFVIEDIAKLRPPPPPALSSEAYALAVSEVQTLGARASNLRSVEQTETAQFWADFNYTSTPPGHWNEVAREVARSGELDVSGAARLFALLNTALADAGIAAFDCKYHYNFWRPVSAVRRAGEDNNDATHPDTSWESLLPSPPHPEYVSAHSVFSATAAAVLATFFGSDSTEFSVGSDTLEKRRRHYTSFRGCAEEVGMSRVYGGIHFRFSNEQGLALGFRVATAILKESGYDPIVPAP